MKYFSQFLHKIFSMHSLCILKGPNSRFVVVRLQCVKRIFEWMALCALVSSLPGCLESTGLYGTGSNNAPVVVNSVTPSSGTTAGGSSILISGSGFLSGANVTIGGTSCIDLTVVSPTQINCVTTPHSPGSVDVVISNPDGQVGALSNGFTYVKEPPPVIFTVTPSLGSPDGGTLVAISGSGFVSGLLIDFGGVNCPVAAYVDSSQVYCVTGPHAGGTVDVTLTNPDGQFAVRSGAFLYQILFSLTAVSPSAGGLNGGTQLSLTGIGFPVTASVTVGGVACNSTAINSSTNITCSSPSHAAGSVDVTVYYGDGRTSTITNAFTYQNGPTIVSLSPTSGPLGGGTLVNIIGSNFMSGAQVTMGSLACNVVAIPTTSLITCITAPHVAGTVDVTVINTDQQFSTLAGAFTFQGGPVLQSVSPQVGPLAGGTPLTLTGTGFQSGDTVTIGGNPCGGLSVVSPTRITCTAPAHAAGTVDLTVTQSDGQFSTLSSGYVYQSAPSLATVAPPAGGLSGGNVLTLTGTGFLAGASVSIGGSPCSSVTVVAQTQVTCVTVPHAAGTFNVTLTNSDGQFSTLSNAYTYEPGPSLTSVNPTGGPLAGGTAIILSGSGFNPAATVTIGGTNCQSVVVASANQIACTTPAGSAGAANVVVTNPDDQASTLIGGFTYNPAPAITSVAPVGGTSAGGTAITMVGTGFQPGLSVDFGGAPCTVSLSTATQIFCTTTAHAAGAVTVTVSNVDSQFGALPNGFTYESSPGLVSINPTAGALGGGTTLTLIGSGFLTGASVSVGGASCTGVNVVNSSQVTCTTPIHVAGVVDVTITNVDTQSSTLAASYTYEPGPTLTSVAPVAGPVIGGTAITLTGTNFMAGATVLVGGAACGSINILSSTSITCLTPAHSAGAVNVTVTNLDNQFATLTNVFTYQAGPVVSSVTPAFGPLAGGTGVSITGTGFLAGAAVTFGGVNCTSINVISLTQIQCTTPPHAAGAVNVIVTNTDTQTSTLVNGYLYEGGPVLTSLSPTAGPLGGANLLTLTGSGFISGATVNVAANPCASVNVVNATTITCNAPAHAAGTVSVTVTNPDAQASTLPGSYTYNPAPAVTSISPISGPLAGGTAVTITGTNFINGITATVGAVTCNVSLSTATQIFCTTGAHSAGAVSVAVTNPDGQIGTLTNAFNYQAVPTLTSVTPPEGALTGGTLITLAGTGFVAGASVLVGGNSCTGVSVVSPTQATCTTESHVAGAVDVIFTNADLQTVTLTNGFTYQGPPVVSSVSPTSGPLAGGTALTITGSNFLAAATATVGGAACASLVVVNATTITCNSPAHAAGNVDVVVTNSDNQSGTLTGGFTYNVAPVISSVAPPAGPLAGGMTITLSGSSFLAGATVTVGGGNCTSVNVISSNSISCVTPPHGVGSVNVSLINPDGQSTSLTNSYTYEVPPSLTSLSPNDGTVNGGTPITLTGTAFLTGATVTVGSGNCTFVTVINSTSIACLTPPGPAGAANVTVTNTDGQLSTLVGGYTYLAAPGITSIAPVAGALAGSTAVIINGTNFTSPTVDLGGASCTVSSSTSTQIFCTTGAHAAGAVTVRVTNTDGQVATLVGGYTYEAAPTVTSVVPAIGGLAGGNTITINGTGFQAGPTVSVGGANCGSVSVTNSTSLTCVTPAHVAATVNVIVTNFDNQSGTLVNGFTYSPGPQLSTVSPTAGALAGGTTLTLTGTNLLNGVTATVGGTACSNLVWSSSSQITCTSPSHPAGAVDVAVTNPDGQVSTLTSSYLYEVAPSVTGVIPTQGGTGGGTNITVTGTGFLPGAGVTVGGATCIGVNVASSTTITCTTGAHVVGTVAVQVTHVDTQVGSLSNAYTYETGPSLTSISPVAGALGGGTLVTLTGTSFTSGATVILGGQSCSSVNVLNSTTATCLTAPNSAGTYDVTITNPDTQSSTLTASYTYQAAPTISSIAPVSGPLAGGTAVTITGTGFHVGITADLGGATCNVTLVTSTQVFCTTTAHAAGVVSVHVVNTDTQSASLAGAFTYQAAPTLTSVAPVAGALGGGTTLTLIGTGFLSGVGVTIGGGTCTSVLLLSATQLTCLSPGHSAGTVNADRHEYRRTERYSE